MSDQIYFFDTTLRDGEQCPGASMNLREKLEVARQMERLGMDVIEAGFPCISDGDFETVHTIARNPPGNAPASTSSWQPASCTCSSN